MRVSFLCSWLLSLLFIGQPSIMEAQFRSDSLLAIARHIPDDFDRLNFLDSLVHTGITTGTPNPVPLIFARQELAALLNQEPLEAAYITQAVDFMMKNQLTAEADSLIQPYLDQLEALSTDSIRLEILSSKGAMLSNSQHFQEASDIYQKMIAIQQANGQQNPYSFLNLGKNLAGMGKNGEASVAFGRAKELFLVENDSLGMNEVLLELGILFSQIGMYDEAEEYILDRQRYIYPPSPTAEAIDRVNLGRNLLIQRKYQAAQEMYLSAWGRRPYMEGYFSISFFALNGLVETHYFLGNTDSVEHYFRLISGTKETLNDAPYFQFLYDQSHFLYQTTQQNFDQASQIMDKLYAQAIEKQDRSELLMYNQFLADMHEKAGNYQLALKYQRLYSRGLDSTQAANKTQALLLYQTQYETREKENLIQTLQTEKELQEAKNRIERTWLIVGIIGVAMLAIVGLLILFYRNKIQRAVEVENLRTKISSDLHDDIGSLLTGLAMQAELLPYAPAEQQKAQTFHIAELGRSAMSRMRDAVWAMNAQKDNWASLLDRMREFGLEILASRQIELTVTTSGIDLENKLPGDIRQHLYLIYKEAITNVAKHAKDATEVVVQFIQSPAGLHLKIHDNGSPLPHPRSSSGLGMQNMHKRATSLGGTMATRYKSGFCIEVSIPS